MVKHHKPDPPDDYRTIEARTNTVNPPTPFTPAHSTSGAAASLRVDVAGTEADAPCHMTFDEMRELPMHLALGFDLEGDQS